jgi:hypothetical protein
VLVLPFSAGQLSIGLTKGAKRCWVGQHRDRFLERFQVVDGEQDRGGASVHRDGDPFVLIADARY